MQPGHYFFIDGRDEEWPEVWWCDQICHIHEKVWGRNLFFSIHKSEQRFILGLLQTLQTLLWTFAFLPMFVQGSCFSSWLSLCLFFVAKKITAEFPSLPKKMKLFWEFRNSKKNGCFFFFSQLFLMAQNLLLAVQLGGQGSLVSVSFWTEGPGHDRKIHWQMQPEDGGPRVSWTRFYVGVNHRGWMFLEILLTNEDGFSTR